MRVTIGKASELTGYTEKAIRAKIAQGVWPEGWVWFRAPDGRVHIEMDNYQKWAEGQGFVASAGRYRSTFATRASGAGKGSD